MKTVILEERGYFWWHDEPVPDGHWAPESSVSGVLRIDEEGRIELELDNVLSTGDGIFAAVLNNGTPFPANKEIQGAFKGSGNFALLGGLFRNGGRFSSNGISFEQFLVTNCLVSSTPFARKQGPFRFRGLQVDLKGFEGWLRLGAIESSRTKSSLNVKYKNPKPVSYAIDDGAISIRYDLSGPWLGKQTMHDLVLAESASISYSFKESILLDDIKAQYGLMEDLFILLTDSDYCFDWPLLTDDTDGKNYRLYFLRNRSSAIAPDWHECPTNFVQLREHFGKIFSTWKRKREMFGPGFYLYLGTRRGILLYQEHRFVNLIWGIESLHRRKTKDSTTSENLKERAQRILSQVTSETDKEWLQKKLKHADEPTLEQRIFETFQGLPIGLDQKRIRRFASDCARIRNDISHFGGQRHDGNYGEFLLCLDKKSDALSYLYHALLLKEVGVDDAIVRGWIFDGFRSHRIKGVLVDVGLLDAGASVT